MKVSSTVVATTTRTGVRASPERGVISTGASVKMPTRLADGLGLGSVRRRFRRYAPRARVPRVLRVAQNFGHLQSTPDVVPFSILMRFLRASLLFLTAAALGCGHE